MTLRSSVSATSAQFSVISGSSGNITVRHSQQARQLAATACGSGGLLIKSQLRLRDKVAQRLGVDVHDLKPGDVQRPLQLYGQEINHVTYAMAKMNAFVHDMDADIALGDTMKAPRFLSPRGRGSWRGVAA